MNITSPPDYDLYRGQLDQMENVAVHRAGKEEGEADSYVLKVRGVDGKLLTLPEEMVEKRKGKMFLKGTELELTGRADKMSKSRGNVVNPDDIVREYGADSLRLYEMFMGPLEAVKPWNTRGVEGVHRFLSRVWRLIIDEAAEQVQLHPQVHDVPPDRETLRWLHRTIRKVTEDTEALRFNTAIAAMMELVNYLTRLPVRPKQVLETFVLLLSPYAPHIAEELWRALGHPHTLAYEPWPTYDPELLRDEQIEIPIQVNGKVRSRLLIAPDTDEATVQAAALADPAVQPYLSGRTVKMVKVVPGRLVNIVVA
ncbi:MAG: class I tRNA ligase family protein [Thermogemmata sp.]|nr:class I tRNA ligase family protein [Thermogemmata sp.]